jgi:hypothetical protein
MEFLPIAYCRVILTEAGAVRFPDSFIRMRADGTYQERKFETDPVWEAVVSFIDVERQRGVSSKDFIAIAGRCAIFDAVNNALNAGSKLEDLFCDAPVFLWPENGPDPDQG